MQIYAIKMQYFYRFGDKNNSIVFDLDNKTLAKDNIDYDLEYDKVKRNPIAHAKSVKEKGYRNVIGIVGVVDGDSNNSNGAGKSTVMEALCYAYYEKITRRNADGSSGDAGLSVVTKINGEYVPEMTESFVEVIFEENDIIYRIKRGRSFSKSKKSHTPILEFESYNSKEDEEKDSLSGHRTGDTKKQIANVIKMDYDVFVNSQMEGQEEAGKYLSGADKAKTDILISILNLSNIVDKCLKITRDRKNDLIKKVDLASGETSLIEDNIVRLHNKTFPEDEKVSFSEAMFKKIGEELKSKWNQTNDSIIKKNDKQSELEKTLSVLKNNEKISEIRHLTDSLKNIDESILRLNGEEKRVSDKIKFDIEDLTRRLSSKKADIDSKEAKISRYRKEIDSLNLLISKFDQAIIDKKMAGIESKRIEKLAVEASLKKLVSEKDGLIEEKASLKTKGLMNKEVLDKFKKQLDEFSGGSTLCSECESVVTKEHVASKYDRYSQIHKTLQEKFKEKSEQLKKASEDIDKIYLNLKDIDKVLSEEIGLSNQIAQNKNNISNKEKYSKEIVEIDAEIVSMKKEAVEMSDRIGKLNKDIVDVNLEFVQKRQVVENERISLQGKIDVIRKDVDSVLREIDACEKEILSIKSDNAKLNEICGSIRREGVMLKDYREQWMAKSGNKVKLQGDLENYLIIEDVFGLEGIQKSIIKKYLPLLNAYVKEALDIISGGKMSIKQFINDKMEIETIISGGSSDNFRMLSSGEKKIVRLAVGTGLALLSFVRSSQKPEIICLDEVFSSLDVNHVEGVFNLIEYLKEKFTRVLIISHSKDVNERIPCTITIEKNGGMYGLSKVVKIV